MWAGGVVWMIGNAQVSRSPSNLQGAGTKEFVALWNGGRFGLKAAANPG
jgi:hypothetical protein